MPNIITDTFTRDGDLHGSAADTGQIWEVLSDGGWITENGEASPVRPSGMDYYPSSETALIDAGVSKVVLDCTFLVRREPMRWEGKTVAFYALYKDADNFVRFRIQRNGILTYWQFDMEVRIAGTGSNTTSLPTTKYDEQVNRVRMSVSRDGGMEIWVYNTDDDLMFFIDRAFTSGQYDALRAGTKVGILTTNTDYPSFDDNSTGAMVGGFRERGFTSFVVDGVPASTVRPPLHQNRNDGLNGSGKWANARTKQTSIWQNALL